MEEVTGSKKEMELSSVRLADMPSLPFAPGRGPVDLSFGTHYQIA